MALRILSYNILAGGEDRLSLISSIIQRQQPDVVALLEARSLSNAEILAQQLGMNLTVGEATNINKDHVIWLSRLEVIRTENHHLPVFAKTLLEIEIRWEGAPLVLYATHLKAGRNEEHEQRRAAEMQTIIEIMRQIGNQPHLLVGDLNALHPEDQPNASMYLATEPWEKGDDLDNVHIRQAIPLLLSVGYVDCYRELHPATPGYTYKLPTPGLRLDYIFASPPLAKRLHASDVVTGGEAEMASDHYPVWVEFS
jgi:endonuclease/exonuclease/phosphatase family metal-dependent hydrolase